MCGLLQYSLAICLTMYCFKYSLATTLVMYDFNYSLAILLTMSVLKFSSPTCWTMYGRIVDNVWLEVFIGSMLYNVWLFIGYIHARLWLEFTRNNRCLTSLGTVFGKLELNIISNTSKILKLDELIPNTITGPSTYHTTGNEMGMRIFSSTYHFIAFFKQMWLC